jgi:hypothetical protein
MSDLFRDLDPREQADFRLWARNNYKPLDPILGLWHPIIQDECAKINAQATLSDAGVEPLEPVQPTCQLVWRNPETGLDDPVIGTADYIPGTALAFTFTELPDGSLEPHYVGQTDVHWDGQFNCGEHLRKGFAVVTESGEIVSSTDCTRIPVKPTDDP